MKISIYEAPKPEPKPEPEPRPNELCLRLTLSYGGRVQVIAVDPDTGIKLDGGVLLTFTRTGTFLRADNIRAPGAGVETDSRGRMVEAVL